MRRLPLGRSSLQVAPLAFGGNVFGWSADEARSFELLDAFTDAGFNLIDTADMYSSWVPGNQGGESEAIIGRWLKKSGKRNRVLIATKVGKLAARPGLSAANIRVAVEESLQRLQTDVIDLYQSHADDLTILIPETLGAFAELVKQGKVRVLGASNFSVTRLAESLEVSRSHGFPRYEVLQPHYNLCERAAYESELEPLVQQEGLSVISYYSLAGGFLSGKYRSEADLSKSRARGAGAKKYLDAKGLAILDAVDGVAARLKATPAQVALAWLMTRPGVTAPIVSATTVPQLQELALSADLVLSPADLAALDGASL